MSSSDCFIRPGSDWVPRLMVIDGCNVGRSSCGAGRELVNCAGVMSVVRWLLVRDFDVVVFLPVIYNNTNNYNARDVHILPKLEELGLVTFTPARTGRGERKAFINYDDLYVLTLAARHGGCILSGDKFKDILADQEYSEFHDSIRNRTLDVRFHFIGHEMAAFEEDIFYQAVPELFIPAPLNVRAKRIANKIYAPPDDPEFQQVKLRRSSWSPEKKAFRLRAIDDMLDEMLERAGTRRHPIAALPVYGSYARNNRFVTQPDATVAVGCQREAEQPSYSDDEWEMSYSSSPEVVAADTMAPVLRVLFPDSSQLSTATSTSSRSPLSTRRSITPAAREHQLVRKSSKEAPPLLEGVLVDLTEPLIDLFTSIENSGPPSDPPRTPPRSTGSPIPPSSGNPLDWPVDITTTPATIQQTSSALTDLLLLAWEPPSTPSPRESEPNPPVQSSSTTAATSYDIPLWMDNILATPIERPVSDRITKLATPTLPMEQQPVSERNLTTSTTQSLRTSFSSPSEEEVVVAPKETVAPREPETPPVAMDWVTSIDSERQPCLDLPNLEKTLRGVFPSDVVQRVLLMNASRDLDFLADQCMQLMVTD